MLKCLALYCPGQDFLLRMTTLPVPGTTPILNVKVAGLSLSEFFVRTRAHSETFESGFALRGGSDIRRCGKQQASRLGEITLNVPANYFPS